MTSCSVSSSSCRSRKACPTSTHSSSLSSGSLTTVNFNLPWHTATQGVTVCHMDVQKSKTTNNSTFPDWGRCLPAWCRGTAWVVLSVIHPHRSLREKDLRLTSEIYFFYKHLYKFTKYQRSPTSCEVVVNLLTLHRLAEGHGRFCGFQGNTQQPIFHVNTLHWLVQSNAWERLKCQRQYLHS